MYKAKCNIFFGEKYFEIGKTYSKKDIEGLDINDFEVVGEVEVGKKPKSMTTKSLKTKK